MVMGLWSGANAQIKHSSIPFPAKSNTNSLTGFFTSKGLIIDDNNHATNVLLQVPTEVNTLVARGIHKNNPAKASEKNNRIAITFSGEIDPYDTPFIRFYDKSNLDDLLVISQDMVIDIIDEENSWIFSIPTGTYDIMIGWSEIESNKVQKHRCFIAQPDVTIDSDQEFIMDKKDAQNSVQFNFKLPNGEYAKWPGVMVNDEGNIVRDWADANVGRTNRNIIVCHPYFGPILNTNLRYNAESDGSIMEEYNIKEDFTLWCNDFPEYMWVTQHIVMENEAGEIYSSMASTTVARGENIVECNHEQYKQIEEEFVHSPYAFGEEGRINYYSHGYAIDENIIDWPGFCFLFHFPIEGKCAVYTSTYPFYVDGKNVTYSPISITNYDLAEEMKLSEESSSWRFNGITSPEIISIDNTQYYLNTTWDDFLYHSLFRAPEGGYYRFAGILPRTNTHPIFSYSPQLRQQKLGNNSPILTILTIDYGTLETKLPITIPAIKGRYGESRLIDLEILTNVLSIDGVKMFEGYWDDLVGYMFTNYTDSPEGLVEIVFTDENVSVDDLSGKNITEIGYEKNGEDVWTPTLQMLHFRDQDGIVTDRFETGKDGILELAGGDFIEHYDEDNNYWYTEEEAQVSVEYAPYNTGDFSALEVDEIPELYFMPGFGHFYRGSLASVDRTSETGWFDLRITLVDKAGNYQKQTISPAFKIEDLMASVDVIGNYPSDVRVENRNIIVPEGSKIFTTHGILSDGIDVMPGIYIISTPNGTSKICVK